MKIIRKVAIMALFIQALFSMTSCFVVLPQDQGNHNGWYKNSNNPHNPLSTNPGHSKGKH
jgi:hypothetical protein